MRRTHSQIALLLAIALSVVARGADLPPSDIPRDALTGIEAMRRLPVDGLHVVESNGRMLLVSTNGHYVVTGGRLFDLWNQLEVHSVKDLDSTTRLPLSRMGINSRVLGGTTFGREDTSASLTIFMDPASPESRKVLDPLRELAKRYRVDVVFLPAQPSRAGVARALICDAQAAQAFLKEGRVPPPLPDSQPCGVQELDRIRATVQLLGIKTLPFTVAPDGWTLPGVPPGYAEFVANHQEAR